MIWGILIAVFLLILILSKTNDTANDFIRSVTKEWVKARTIFTAAFYGAFLFCILKKVPIPPELNTIISTLFGYWFGQKSKKEEVKQ